MKVKMNEAMAVQDTRSKPLDEAPVVASPMKIDAHKITYLLKGWKERVGGELKEKFSYEHWLLGLIAFVSTAVFVGSEWLLLNWLKYNQTGINWWAISVIAGLIWIGAVFEWHLHDNALHDHNGILHGHKNLRWLEREATEAHEQHHGGTRLEIIGETDDAYIVLDLYQYTRHKQLEHGTFGWYAIPLFQLIFGFFVILPVAIVFRKIGAIYVGNVTVALFYMCYETFHYYKHLVSPLAWPSTTTISGRLRLFSRALHYLHHLITRLSQNVVIPLEDLRRHTCIGLIAPPQVIPDVNGAPTKRFEIKKHTVRDFRLIGTAIWILTGNPSRLQIYSLSK